MYKRRLTWMIFGSFLAVGMADASAPRPVSQKKAGPPQQGVTMMQTYNKSDLQAAVERLREASMNLRADAFAQLFAEDADFYNPIGMRLQGRQAIKEFHEKLFAPEPPPGFPSFTHATSTVDIVSIRNLKPDLALVDWEWTQRGATMNGKEWPERRGMNTMVWSLNARGEWLVVAWRDKDYPNIPGAPRYQRGVRVD
jgi:uncharacterized protein (TIGR02246 family)